MEYDPVELNDHPELIVLQDGTTYSSVRECLDNHTAARGTLIGTVEVDQQSGIMRINYLTRGGDVLWVKMQLMEGTY